MTKSVEFSKAYKILHSIKEGNENEKAELESLLREYKEATNAESFLHELGQIFLCIGVEKLYEYSKSNDLEFIGKITKEEWQDLANNNKADLPPYLANAMIKHAKDNQTPKDLSSKWEISKREVEKHVMNMARYITEGIIDTLE